MLVVLKLLDDCVVVVLSIVGVGEKKVLTNCVAGHVIRTVAESFKIQI